MNHEKYEKYEKIVYKEESYLIQGAIFEVYKEMGSGFFETVYQECLEREFQSRGIPFVPQQGIALSYKGVPLTQRYTPDFICFEKIIVELKAVQSTEPVHQAQVFNFLKATGFALGLLVNFGAYPKAEINRIVSRNFSRFS